MSYNGSGLFQINTSGQPVVAGTVITASAFNALTADLATGLTTAITKDGQTATTAQIPFAQGLRSTLVTDSTTSTSGSIITDGGLGVAKAVNIGTTLGVTGAITGSSTITGTKLIPTGTSATGNGMYLPATNTLGFSTNGTLAAVIDASQNVGVGVTPSAWGSGRRSLSVAGSTANYFVGANANATVFGTNTFHDGSDNKYIATGYANLYLQSSGQHLWYNAASGTAGNAITFTQAMTLDTSGNFLLGVTTAGSSGVSGFSFNSPTGPSNVWIGHTTGTASGTAYVGFNYNGSGIGSITQQSTTSVNFNGNSVPPSDQRLKTNIVDAPDALPLLSTIQIRSFDWIGDNQHQTYGAIAQELKTIAPEFVPTHEDPEKMLGIDYGKMVPMLIKGLQEQQALITQLQANVAALKG